MNHPRLLPQRQRGLTLVELVTVLAVAAIVAGTAAPGLRQLIDARRLDGAATRLAADLRYARTAAIAANQPLRLSVQAVGGGSCWLLHTGDAADCRCPAGDGPAQCSGTARELKTVRLPAGERVGLQSNAASLLFDPLHGTVTPTATLRLTAADGRAVHHIVNVMGRVRSCSPLAAVPGYRAC